MEEIPEWNVLQVNSRSHIVQIDDVDVRFRVTEQAQEIQHANASAEPEDAHIDADSLGTTVITVSAVVKGDVARISLQPVIFSTTEVLPATDATVIAKSKKCRGRAGLAASVPLHWSRS